MSNRSDLLKKLTNVSEECSDIHKSDAISFELSSEDEAVHIQGEAFEIEDSDEESTTPDENENIINMPRKICRMRIISDSDEETENTFQEIETAANSTVWSKFEEASQIKEWLF
ncbi:hypothetical protein ANTQUA_LOCUS8179 [Anthophora quadrimaculata]